MSRKPQPKLLFICSFLSLLSLDGWSQVLEKKGINVVEIDPRQYVTVLYNRYRTREKLETIWNWDERKGVPNQKYNSLDDAGQINIIFDKYGLIRNTDFFGNVTLEAEISGSKGTRQIEVNPYSEIGVARKAIGIKSDPPYDVSNKLLSMLAELSDVDTIRSLVDQNFYSFRYRNASIHLKEVLSKAIQDCDLPRANLDSIKNQAINAYQNLFNSSPYYYSSSGDAQLVGFLRQTSDKDKIKLFLTDMQSGPTLSNALNYQNYFVSSYKKAAGYIADKLPLILEYLNSFEKGGQEGLKAFLSLTSLTLIKYTDVKNTLIKDKDTLATLRLPRMEESTAVVDSILLLYKDPIDKAVNSLYYLSRLQGSEIERIILSFATSSNVRNPALDSLASYGFSPSYNSPNTDRRRKVITDVINSYKDTL
ncbi:MAG TPA: hypothetical protein VI233_18390, partial [Puia sp.]